MDGRSAQSFRSILLHLVLAAAAFVFLLPFLWLVCTSFKRPDDVFSYSFIPWSHPSRLTLQNFRVLFSHETFGQWLINSLFLASLQTVLVVTFSSLGGFALAKYDFRGTRPLMFAMLATMLLPGVVLLPGYLELMLRLGWLN